MAAVLVVDDDDTIRDALYELFAEDHLCHAAETAEKAISFLDEMTYDVVLTDLSMPGLSGLELLGHVRQRQPYTPVIIVSGISDQAHAQGLMRMGAFDYLLKPFRMDHVEDCVARAIEHRRQLLKESQRGETSSDAAETDAAGETNDG